MQNLDKIRLNLGNIWTKSEQNWDLSHTFKRKYGANL